VDCWEETHQIPLEGTQGQWVLPFENPLAIIPEDQRVTSMDYNLLQEFLSLECDENPLVPYSYYFTGRLGKLVLPEVLKTLVVSSAFLRPAILTLMALERAISSREARPFHQDAQPGTYLAQRYELMCTTRDHQIDTAFEVFYHIRMAIKLNLPKQNVMAHLLLAFDILKYLLKTEAQQLSNAIFPWIAPIWDTTMRDVQDYMMFAEDVQDHTAFAHHGYAGIFEQLGRLQDALQNYPITLLDGRYIHVKRRRLRYSVEFYLVQYNLELKNAVATQTYGGLEVTARKLLQAIHEYTLYLHSSPTLIADVSTLCRVNLDWHSEEEICLQLRNRFELFEYFSKMLIEATMGNTVAGHSSTGSVAVFAASTLCRLVASSSTHPRLSIRCLFLAGLVLTKSRYPEGTLTHVLSHFFRTPVDYESVQDLG